MADKGARMISSAILGLDIETVTVNNKIYVVKPPTIAKLAGAGAYLSEVDEALDINSIFKTVYGGADNLAYALSWLIQGDESLFGELRQGTFDELVNALTKCTNMISAQGFIMLSGLTKSVRNLIARPQAT